MESEPMVSINYIFYGLVKFKILALINNKNYRCFLFALKYILILFFWLGTTSFSQSCEFLKKNKIINTEEFIFHHISDSHKWPLWGSGEKNVSLSLPIILWDKGFQLFYSSYLSVSKNCLKHSGKYYRIIQENIYKTDFLGSLQKDTLGNIRNPRPLDFSITKNVFASFISFLLMFSILKQKYFSYKAYQYTYFFSNLLEILVLFVRDELTIPHIGMDKYKSYLPFLLTVFFYILFNNLLGLLPSGANVTGNISTTLMLSFTIFIIVNVNSKKSYWRHILWMPGVPFPVRILLAPIELAGIFIRPLTLCIRLFANITAGHIIILSFISLIFIFKNFPVIVLSVSFTLFILSLKIIVAFLQAFIFTTLSALFIGRAIH